MAPTATARASERGEKNRIDVLLVCSAGGHLLQLSMLAQAWTGLSHAWVTLDREDARLLEGERVFFGHGPTERNIPNLVRNIVLARKLLRELRPRAIVTTGAGLAVPFAWLGRLSGATVIYVESLTRIHGTSLTYRLVKPVANRMYVQWPELAAETGALYAGNVLQHG